MSTYAADDFEFIRRREEEIRAERNLALTGSSAPAQLPGPNGMVWSDHYDGWVKADDYTA